MRDLHRRTALMAGIAAALVAGSAVAQERSRRGERRRRRAEGAVAGGRSDAPHASVSTGPDPKQAYDLYVGSATGPVLAYIHGGGWSQGDKAMVHSLPGRASGTRPI